MERIALTDSYSISRLIKGGWHLAGGHGAIDPIAAIADMAAFAEAGINTFDCADIYTGVEALIGEYRRQYPALAANTRVHTKFVPDLETLSKLKADDITKIIDRSLQRLGVEQLDLRRREAVALVEHGSGREVGRDDVELLGDVLAAIHVAGGSGHNGDNSVQTNYGDVPHKCLHIDMPTTLVLNKEVVNDNGGSKVIADFPLFVNGNAVTSGTAAS